MIVHIAFAQSHRPGPVRLFIEYVRWWPVTFNVDPETGLRQNRGTAAVFGLVGTVHEGADDHSPG